VRVVSSRTLTVDGGRELVVHDGGDSVRSGAPTIVWHHGSPQTGALLAPLLEAATARGVRLVSYGRPGYGGSSPLAGRDVASAAADVGSIADALGLERFAVMGASGGGPHALACAALLPGRTDAVVLLAGLAPFGAAGLDWFGGMAADGASLRAALEGRGARERHEAESEFDPESFILADYAALERDWSTLGDDVAVANAAGPGGLIDDDLAYVAPWGFDVSSVAAPVLVVHGGEDRVVPVSHGRWLAQNCARGELWLRPRAGHISILSACPLAMDWIAAVRKGTLS
jgi:pimeloyl-ACP methyl ester carboxylesterase